MIETRRRLLVLGGGLLATLAVPSTPLAKAIRVIEMRGTARGERVWFAPNGVAVDPGTTLHFVNRDPGGSHTATAYHPENFQRIRRMPDGAKPWDSGFLLPNEGFRVTLTLPGVYDYYCRPHERAGMVGRIVVGAPHMPDWRGARSVQDDVPEAALAAFPEVGRILREGPLFPRETLK